MNGSAAGRRLNIYLGNHHPRDGVRDYVSILRGVCEYRGVEVGESEELDPAAVNVVIDEFTRPAENARISRFRKRYPGACLVFVLTEFLEQRHGVRSMNHFGGVVDTALVAAANVWIRSRRSDFHSARWPEWALFWLYLPVAAAFGAATALAYVSLRFVRPIRAAKLLAQTRIRVGRLVYFHKRYAGLESHIHHADFLLAGHESIWPALVAAGWLRAGDPVFAGVVYPELDEEVVLAKLRVERSPDIEITGSITSFRQDYIDQVNALIESAPYDLGHAQARPFGAAGGGRAAYSLHPPQTAHWGYASPTRLYRALQVDGTIPIITRHFGQHPLEDLCWRFEGAGTLEKLSGLHADGDRAAALIAPRMERYNAIARGRNDGWTQALCPDRPARTVRDRPLVSIVMPSYQQGRYIGEAISSVRRQSYSNIELIIVDGGSSDNTSEVVRRHGRGVSCWISEPDEGTSDAINKGFARARGAYVWVLNADDMLAGTDAVDELARYLDEHAQVDFVYGDMMMIDESGGYIGLRRFPRYDIPTLLMDRRHLPFPGCLMRRRALAEVGGFDETLRYANDLDYFLRLARRRELGSLGKVTGVFRIHGDASTQRHVAESGSEAAAVCLKYLGECHAAGSLRVPVSRVRAAVYGYCASFNFHAGRTRETAAAVLSAFRSWPASTGSPKLWIYLAASLLGSGAMLRVSGVTRRLIRRRLFFAINNRGQGVS